MSNLIIIIIKNRIYSLQSAIAPHMGLVDCLRATYMAGGQSAIGLQSVCNRLLTFRLGRNAGRVGLPLRP